MKVLFVDQGRAAAGAAMGHVRAKHARQLVPPPVGTASHELEVRPFNRIERILARRAPQLPADGLFRLRWHLVRGWVARRTISRAVGELRPDVVHVTTDQAALMLSSRAFGRTPIVPSLDVLTIDWVRLISGMPAGNRTERSLRSLEALERRVLDAAAMAIAWTDTVAARVGALAPACDVRVLHPGLDLSAFRPRARKPGPRVRVLFVGGRWKLKGGPDLLRALGPRLGRDVQLDVVTTEPLEGRDGMTVHRGSPGSGEVAELFATADLLCLPTRADAVPWVVLEAMASGVPVVSTAIGSIPEMVGDGGVIVADVEAELAGALDRLIDDRDARERLGEAARSRAEGRFDAAVNTPRLFELLREAASRGAA